jgi:hypothetical protein
VVPTGALVCGACAKVIPVVANKIEKTATKIRPGFAFESSFRTAVRILT